MTTEATVYKLKNDITDDFYIGSTSGKLTQRLASHCYCAKKRQSLLYKKMSEVGIDNWKIEKIVNCDKENKNSVEEIMILLYKPNLNTKSAFTGIPKGANYKKVYYEMNKDKAKEYYEKNKALYQSYYINNREKIISYNKQRYHSLKNLK